MKKLSLLCIISLLPIMAFALTPDQLPDSISITTGVITLRLDKAKRWHINAINHSNQKMCLDSPGAHYGTVFFYKDTDGFCGSGHVETGHVEQVQSVTILQDGKEITADELKQGPIMGRTIRFEKHSMIRDFNVFYRFLLTRDMLDEFIEITANQDVNLRLCYHFMHPWRVEFDEMLAIDDQGNETAYTFKGDGAFALKGKARPFVAWYDRQSKKGVVTILLPGECHKDMTRMVWDRNIYRKDYFADYLDSVFPKGTMATYHIRTGFFTSQPETWKETAKNLKLK